MARETAPALVRPLKSYSGCMGVRRPSLNRRPSVQLARAASVATVLARANTLIV